MGWAGGTDSPQRPSHTGPRGRHSRDVRVGRTHCRRKAGVLAWSRRPRGQRGRGCEGVDGRAGLLHGSPFSRAGPREPRVTLTKADHHPSGKAFVGCLQPLPGNYGFALSPSSTWQPSRGSQCAAPPCDMTLSETPQGFGGGAVTARQPPVAEPRARTRVRGGERGGERGGGTLCWGPSPSGAHSHHGSAPGAYLLGTRRLGKAPPEPHPAGPSPTALL